MMRAAMAGVLLLLLGVQKQEVVFRNVVWGMEPAQVLAVETAQLIKESPGRLFYRGEEEGYPAIIVYSFVENKLIQATCIFQYEGTVSTSDLIKDLEHKLTRKFGQPEIVKANYKAVWGTSSTHISLNLTDEQKVVLNYLSSQLAKEFAGKWKSSM
ncbi:MAG: hypothetical protein NZM05_00775 [Chloroherpetonaceae bacterium]|nr:hypothetical protein [Chloroherpetonaceae bacterium]